MAGFVKNLKDKPRDVRNRIAIISAMAFTLLIVGVWILVNQNSKTDTDIFKRSGREDLKPLMMIFGNAKKNFSDIKINITNQEDKQ